ncbi:hypothetical protein FKP32DRAFT_1594644 [Trametes sanguinea]|nr:hypothetical protein FKP32DRAFT_1594644 [Trametes sanguinea]
MSQKQLADKKMPLKLRGREVRFEHILIVNTEYCTKGSIQPTLAILPECAWLYN